MKTKQSSQLSGFYKKTIPERQSILADWSNLTPAELNTVNNGLSLEEANHMIENVIALYNMPLGIATNFLINKNDYLIPLVIEEPSVVAACSFAAKLFRDGGGFKTSSDKPIMIGQLQLLNIENIQATELLLQNHKQDIIDKANEVAGSIIKRGGGAINIEIRCFPETAIGNMIVIHLLFDTRDAMGANAVNTSAEHLAPMIEDITGGRVNLRILSNLTDRRKAYAEGTVPKESLAKGDLSGEEAVQSIVEAGIFAEVDPYRATTHNKGIMNGIDALLIATGNDWRAVEAGAHAYAARGGTYTSLTKWMKDPNGNLHGKIELPLAVGIVGGATRVHPVAQFSLKLLGIESANQLAEIAAAVGLAQNFAAIRALATEGIQNGHMRMHAKQLAVAAGASTEQVNSITQQMIAEGKIRLERAKELVRELQDKTSNEQ